MFKVYARTVYGFHTSWYGAGVKSDAELSKLLKKFTTSELMREVRRRQVKKSDPEKRSETAKNAAIIRWAKKKGKDILGGNVAKMYLFSLIHGLLATRIPNP